jgi:hypothetical protein
MQKQYIVTKLTTSGGFRHICSKHRTLREARVFVETHRLAYLGFQPRIYRRVE